MNEATQPAELPSTPSKNSLAHSKASLNPLLRVTSRGANIGNGVSIISATGP